MDTAIKTGIDAAKTASKRGVQKMAEAAGDLIRNKIADKITSFGKTKGKEKKDIEKSTYHQKNDSKLWMTCNCFKHHIKMEYQKIANLLDTTLDELHLLLKYE